MKKENKTNSKITEISVAYLRSVSLMAPLTIKTKNMKKKTKTKTVKLLNADMNRLSRLGLDAVQSELGRCL